MFCYNCGEKLQDGAKFCIRCGTPVVKLESKSNEIQPARCPRCGGFLTSEGKCNFCIPETKIDKNGEKNFANYFIAFLKRFELKEEVIV